MKRLSKILLILYFCFSFHNIVLAKEVNAFKFTFENNFEFLDNINGSSLILGNNINDKATVKGINTILANNIKTSGTSDYILYLGNSINISSQVLNDGVIIANEVEFSNEATINRDLVILASEVTLKGTFNRDVTIYANQVEIDEANILGNIKIQANEIEIDHKVNVLGVLKYNDNALIENESNNIKTETFKIQTNEKTTLEKTKDYLWNFIAKVFILLVLVFLVPKLLNKIEKEQSNKDAIIKNIGVGLLSIIVIPFILLILLFSKVSFLVALIGLMVYITFIVLAPIMASYVLGSLLWQKYIGKKPTLYLKGFLGLSIYYLISLIPYLGSVITLLFVLYGFGCLITIFKANRKKK